MNENIFILDDHLIRHTTMQIASRLVNYKGTTINLEDDFWRVIGQLFTENKLRTAVNFLYKKKTKDDLACYDNENVYSMLNSAWSNPKYRPLVRKAIGENLKQAIATIKHSKQSTYEKRIDELCRTFKLDEEHKKIITCILVSSNIFTDFNDILSGYKYRPNNAVNNTTRYAFLTGIKLSILTVKLRLLRQYSILNEEYELHEQINMFLTGLNENSLSGNFFRQFKGKALAMKMHSDDANKHVDLLTQIINARSHNEPLNVLLYGPPGTGKTELVRSLSRQLNKKLFEIKQLNESSSNRDFRYTAIHACANFINQEDSIILIDEADELLNGYSSFGGILGSFSGSSRNEGKNVINEMMDTLPGVFFWISNQHDFIEESTRRRFDYSLELPRLDPQRRKTIWNNAVEQYKLKRFIKKSELDILAVKYEIDAGGVAVACRNFKRLTRGMSSNECDTLAMLDRILTPHCKLLNIKNNTLKTPGAVDYSLEGLNIKSPIPLEHIATAIQRFKGNDKNHGTPNMNLLLYGPSGTGKTEYTKYLARKSQQELIIKTGSDLLGCYVGQTEKNIAEAFREADAKKAILFIDEADGLIVERGNAQRNWEVSQTNEFLCRMENFQGILICATNFKKNLDQASLRRFNLKIEFDFLDGNGNLIFFNRFFGDMLQTPLLPREENILCTMTSLTPGDFKIVHQQQLFLNNTEISNNHLIDALNAELCARNAKCSGNIGFQQ